MESTDNNKMLIKDIERFKKVNNNYHRLLIRYFITTNSIRAIFFYRFLNKQNTKNTKISKMIFKIIFYLSFIINELEIPYTAKIGDGLLIPHPKCIFIHSKSIIGKNVTIGQGVTIGGNIYKTKNGRRSPTIGDNVLIGAGAMVLGPVHVGDNSIIGANAVIIKDVPKDSVAVGVPAKVVKKVDENYYKIMKKNQ